MLPPPALHQALWHCHAGEKGIVCDVEEITMDYVNTAMERLMKNDVHYRCCTLVCRPHAASCGLRP